MCLSVQGGVPHLHPIILALVPCPFQGVGYPSDWSQVPSWGVPKSQVQDGGYPSLRWVRGTPSPIPPGREGVPPPCQDGVPQPGMGYPPARDGYPPGQVTL